jgi:hypothetical protein
MERRFRDFSVPNKKISIFLLKNLVSDQS